MGNNNAEKRPFLFTRLDFLKVRRNEMLNELIGNEINYRYIQQRLLSSLDPMIEADLNARLRAIKSEVENLPKLLKVIEEMIEQEEKEAGSSKVVPIDTANGELKEKLIIKN